MHTNTNKLKSCLCQMFKDKQGCYSIREVVIGLLIIAVIASWIAQQFFSRQIPEFMFYSFASLIGTGCFGYSLEKKATTKESE